MGMVNWQGKRVYLSGPMTTKKDWNRPAFMEAAAYLRNQGAKVFNPAFHSIGQEKTYQAFMCRDLHELTDNMDGKPYYDILAQLPGWDKSNGAKVELIVAKAIGIEVIEI